MENDKVVYTWQSMIQRCTNPKHPFYKDYGGRGITVCKRWRKLKNFREDIGEIPPTLEIDRIDNDGNYEHGNVMFRTHSENQANKRPYGELGIKGVQKKPNGKYVSRIKIKNKWHYLGIFKCPAQASAAFQMAHISNYGF